MNNATKTAINELNEIHKVVVRKVEDSGITVRGENWCELQKDAFIKLKDLGNERDYAVGHDPSAKKYWKSKSYLEKKIRGHTQ